MKQPSPSHPELTTVRGIACIALVAYHVVGPSSSSGLHLPESSQWHHAMNSFDFFRMPLFSVISGYVYAGRRVERSSLPEFFKKKGLRLAAPLLFVTAVMVGLRRFAYGDSTTVVDALGFHYQHLWFIQALILIFTAIAICDSFARLSTFGLLCAGFASVVLAQSFTFANFFSLNGAFYLAPFFLFGMILRTEPAILRSRKHLPAAVCFITIGFVLQQAGMLGAINPIDRMSLAATLCGCGAAYGMLVLCPRMHVIESIGACSYTIYLWHPIAAATARLFVERYAALPLAEEFLLLVIAGVIVPIAIHRIVERVPLLSILAAGIHGSARRRSFSAPAPSVGLRPSHALTWANDNAVGAVGRRPIHSCEAPAEGTLVLRHSPHRPRKSRSPILRHGAANYCSWNTS